MVLARSSTTPGPSLITPMVCKKGSWDGSGNPVGCRMEVETTGVNGFLVERVVERVFLLFLFPDLHVLDPHPSPTPNSSERRKERNPE